MPDRKDVRKLIRDARTWSGWRVVETKAGWMLYSPDKSIAPIAVHGTPSDRRAWQNAISRLRRAGAPI